MISGISPEATAFEVPLPPIHASYAEGSPPSAYRFGVEAKGVARGSGLGAGVSFCFPWSPIKSWAVRPGFGVAVFPDRGASLAESALVGEVGIEFSHQALTKHPWSLSGFVNGMPELHFVPSVLGARQGPDFLFRLNVGLTAAFSLQKLKQPFEFAFSLGSAQSSLGLRTWF